MVKKRKIKIFGVGGGATNIINRMIKNGLTGAEIWVLNTDKQMLKMGHTDNMILLGVKTTEGLGTGGNYKIGECAAKESQQEIKKALEGADMVFITAGLGGGTGTGAPPVIAKVAKELGILTIALVTKPFSWEGNKRQLTAEKGIEKLRECVDAIIVVPNNKMLDSVKKQASLTDAFKIIDEVLLRIIQSILDIITIPGFINIEIADIVNAIQGLGTALIGVGTAHGDNRAVKAAKEAIRLIPMENSKGGNC